MPVIKNEFPILEYDTAKVAVINPGRSGEVIENFPKRSVITFFAEVLSDFVEKNKLVSVTEYRSEMGIFPTYIAEYKGVPVSVTQAVVGSASIAMMADHIIGKGSQNIIICGGCGVLEDIPAGDVIIPTAALRDEGASYHYLPPSREIEIDRDVIAVLRSTLGEFHVPYVECKTWTTDGFFRETPDMITHRLEEGCKVVEMECATIAAVARFRGVKFGQLLYSGDILTDFDNYDEREWWNKLDSREKLFNLALEAAIKL